MICNYKFVFFFLFCNG
ncbi:G-ACD-00190 [African swine fever virus]|nr:G-ACD-00190 [African swine fever virus]UVH34786.1 G-ACD-00190 [African swine fever virus]UVH34968.1 G-ACD-00190 [African swine fever virus]UVH35150.1 G-ACD-00190 [African swine fever virus]UVH35332.1 G-ACD-00190 [African swine fever virus]